MAPSKSEMKTIAWCPSYELLVWRFMDRFANLGKLTYMSIVWVYTQLIWVDLV